MVASNQITTSHMPHRLLFDSTELAILKEKADAGVPVELFTSGAVGVDGRLLLSFKGRQVSGKIGLFKTVWY